MFHNTVPTLDNNPKYKSLEGFEKFLCLSCCKFPEFFNTLPTFAFWMNIYWQISKRKVSPVLWDTLYVYFWPLLVILIVHSIVKVWPRIGWPLLARCVNYGRWQEAEFSRQVPAYTPNTGQEDNNIRRGNYSVSGLRYVPVSGVLQQVAIRWAKIGKNTDLSTNSRFRTAH